MLISSDTNVENEERAFPVTTSNTALDVNTCNVLHAHGSTHAHELKPLLDVRATKLRCAVSAADGRGRIARR